MADDYVSFEEATDHEPGLDIVSFGSFARENLPRREMILTPILPVQGLAMLFRRPWRRQDPGRHGDELGRRYCDPLSAVVCSIAAPRTLCRRRNAANGDAGSDQPPHVRLRTSTAR